MAEQHKDQESLPGPLTSVSHQLVNYLQFGFCVHHFKTSEITNKVEEKTKQNPSLKNQEVNIVEFLYNIIVLRHYNSESWTVIIQRVA